jgi:hypothetical protein
LGERGLEIAAFFDRGLKQSAIRDAPFAGSAITK